MRDRNRNYLGLQEAMADVVRALPGENAESSSWDCGQIDFLERSFQIQSLFRHNFIFQPPSHSHTSL